MHHVSIHTSWSIGYMLSIFIWKIFHEKENDKNKLNRVLIKHIQIDIFFTVKYKTSMFLMLHNFHDELINSRINIILMMKID